MSLACKLASMRRWAPAHYKPTNGSAYNDALKQCASPALWFDPEMSSMPPPRGKRGRQQRFSDVAIQTRRTLKVLLGLLLWQPTGFV